MCKCGVNWVFHCAITTWMVMGVFFNPTPIVGTPKTDRPIYSRISLHTRLVERLTLRVLGTYYRGHDNMRHSSGYYRAIKRSNDTALAQIYSEWFFGLSYWGAKSVLLFLWNENWLSLLTCPMRVMLFSMQHTIISRCCVLKWINWVTSIRMWMINVTNYRISHMRKMIRIKEIKHS